MPHPARHIERPSTLAPPSPLSGGFAPWPAGPSQPRSKATAQDLLKLALCFICACLFTACLLNLRAAADVRLRPRLFVVSVPPAPALPGVVGHGAGGSVFAEGR